MSGYRVPLACFAIFIITIVTIATTSLYRQSIEAVPAVQTSIVYDCEQTIVSAEIVSNGLNLYGVVCTGKPSLKYYLVSQEVYAVGQTIGIEPSEVQIIDEEYDNVQPNPLLI